MSNIKRYTRYILNIADLISIVVAFFLAYIIRFDIMRDITFKVSLSDYLMLLFVAIVSYFIVNEMYVFKNDELVKYSSFRIFKESIKIGAFVSAIMLIYLNFSKRSDMYSRIFEVIFIALLILVMFVVRSITKKFLVESLQQYGAVEKIIIIASRNNIFDVIDKSVKEYDWRNKVVGIILEGKKETETVDLNGFRFLGYTENIEKCIENVDFSSVLLAVEKDRVEKKKWIQYFQNLGKVVYVYIREYDYFDSYRNLDSVGDMAVVAYRAVPPVPKRQLILKRFFDLALSLLLLPAFLVLYVCVRLLTGLESKGGVIIPRVRVGKNNIRYYQYRFRVYRHDAKERIEQGKSPFTKVGKFLRKTHLDGAPMLINIC